MASEIKWLCGGDVLVRKQKMALRDGRTVYSAHQWISGSAAGARFSSVSHEGDRMFGRLGTDRLPASIDALPAMSDERSRQVKAWREAVYKDAYELIIKAFPEAAAGRRNMGDIEA
jgi:hypothetical protein